MTQFKMVKSAHWLFVLVFCTFLGVYLFAEEKSATDERTLAHTYQKQGNYRDAWEIYRKLATRRNNTGQGVANDLRGGIDCLKKLNRVSEIDAFYESILKVHSDKPRVLWKIAESLIQGPHYGYIIDRKFIRGNHRGGGRYTYTQNQDRLRALQLMEQAVVQLKSTTDSNLAIDIHYDFAMYFMNGREGGNAWMLQVLTDLNQVPDYVSVSENQGRNYRGYQSDGPQGAPVDEAGKPIFYRVPKSFAVAANDGERWRWLLNQVVALGAARQQDAALQIAHFYRSQFGVQTLQNYMFYFSRIKLDRTEKENEQVNSFSLESLKETETLARLATGIQRITLPHDVNFIRLYQQIDQMGKSVFAENALGQLARIFENRRQYVTAAKYIQQSIEKYGDPHQHKQKQLDQIILNWGQFEPNQSQVAGQGAKVDYRFRNGNQVQFEAYEVHVEKLLDDVKAYLKSGPEKLDWNKLNISNLGYRLVHEQQKKYQGKLVSRWGLKLNPLSGHHDRQITVTTPLQNAGAYLLIAKMNNGNTSRMIVWLDDTVIVHKRMQDRTFYYVADARTGKPVAGANLEYFGYRQKRTGRNLYQIQTTNFAEQTDGNGQAFPTAKLLEQDYQWITIARTKSGRFAYSGFERF